MSRRRHEVVLEASRRSLSSGEVSALVDCFLDLLKDNFKVAQGALQALDSAAVHFDDHYKIHFNALIPVVVNRLSDAKQPVRDGS